jgi:hypothetical protein
MKLRLKEILLISCAEQFYSADITLAPLEGALEGLKTCICAKTTGGNLYAVNYQFKNQQSLSV